MYIIMSRVLISGETLKTIGQGALGAMTFGAYHQFTTNKIMDLNNEKEDMKHREEMNKMESKHKEEIKILADKLEKLETVVSQKRFWW